MCSAKDTQRHRWLALNVFTYLYRRLALYWQVWLTLALGSIPAVTLLASGPVMVESVLDFALHQDGRVGIFPLWIWTLRCVGFVPPLELEHGHRNGI